LREILEEDEVRKSHSTALAVGLLGASAFLAYSTPGRAQARFAPTVELYTGGTPETENIKLGGWGSGKASPDPTQRTVGGTSVKIETNGYYAGGRIQFLSPKEITEQKNDPYGYLEFIVHFEPGTLRQKQASNQGNAGGPGGPGRGGPGRGGGASGGFPGGGFPGGGFPGGGFPGFPGAGGLGARGGEQSVAPDTQQMKVILICEEGVYTATNVPVTLNPSATDNWYSVAIPFVAFKGLDKAPTARVKEIRIFGDYKDTFWIGEIRTTTDDEPISVDPLDDLEVSVDEAVEFSAQGSGGISPLRYTWDFDAADGTNQEDAVGQTVVHVFRKQSKEVPGKPGEYQPYLVTLTVRDITGAKKPVRVTGSVIVNP
jgi:hypothetical protein